MQKKIAFIDRKNMTNTVFPFFGQNLNLLEIKQIADLEHDYKADCLKAIRAYKNWCRAYEEETDLIESFYGPLEGALLREKAEGLISAYWTVRRDFRKILEHYFQKTASPQTTNHKTMRENMPVFLNVA